MDRRTFLHKLMLTAGVGLMPSLAFSDDDEDDNKSTNNNVRFTLANTGINNKHVIVVGGGMAGVTAAKYLRL